MMLRWGTVFLATALVAVTQGSQEWKFDPLTGKKIKKGPPVASMEQQREKANWGRLYFEGGVDGLQYLKGSFGKKNVPVGLHEVVLADPLNACDMRAPEEGEELPYTGKFVYAQRGECTFEAKAVALAAAGASAMIVGNSDAGIAHMPGSQTLELDMASVMVNNYTGAFLETLVNEKRGSSANGIVSTAMVPISCGTRADLHKLNMWKTLDGKSDGEYECITPVDEERKLMDVVEGGMLAFGGDEAEYLTAKFGGPSLGQEYPFFVSEDSACEPLAEEAAGKIVVIRRGSCELLTKAEIVQAAGGVAMVVVNDSPGMARMSTASQWEAAHIFVHAVMTTKNSGESLISTIKSNPEIKGKFEGGRVKESDWKQVVDLIDLDNWPTSKRKGKALYESLSEIHSSNPDRMACLKAGWESFKEDRGIKEEL